MPANPAEIQAIDHYWRNDANFLKFIVLCRGIILIIKYNFERQKLKSFSKKLAAI